MEKIIDQGLEYDAKGDDWVAFELKINYLLITLFESSEDKLIEYLSNKNGKYSKSNRKKTIRNWLQGQTRKPNGFEVSKFKIGEMIFNENPLFSTKSFRLWSFDRFKNRVDSYIKNREVQSHIQYIYFFDNHREVHKVVSFDVVFPNHKREDIIHLQYENILYIGKVESFNNITYIRCKSEYDYIQFIFKISANTSTNMKIFGVAQSVDDNTGKPKAFMALLTSYILSPEEEERYGHKLNNSNTIFADDFTSDCIIKDDFFLENFAQKVDVLGEDLHHYGIDEIFSKEIYLDIVLKEYQSYIKFLGKARKHTKYFISSKKESELFSLKGIYKGERISVTISYFLSMENIFLLDDKNPIVANQIRLIQEDKLDLTYLFVVPDSQLLSDKIIEKIEYMEQMGIEVKMTENTSIGYSKLLMIEDVEFALFKFKDLVGDPTHATRHKKTIDKLYLEQEILRRSSLPLRDFMKQHNPIIGRWYFYSYGSAMSSDGYHEIALDIHNNQVRGEFTSGINEGVVHKTAQQILFIFDTSVIKISIQNINGTLFRGSSIGQDIHINHADLLVFGLLSKDPLSRADALSLLAEIHMKEEADYRLKVSDSFPRRLAEFKASLHST